MRRVLATFGNGDCGRLGLGDCLSEELPRVVRSLLGAQVRAVACGGAHTAVVLGAEGGDVFSFGLNDRGQLGHSAGEAEVPEPRRVPLPEAAVAVAAGYYHTLCLTAGGRLWAWGDGALGQLGLGKDVAGTTEPRPLESLADVKIAALAAGMEHSLAACTSGRLYSWGAAGHGRLGHGSAGALRLLARGGAPGFLPRLVRALEGETVTQVAAGQLHSGCVTQEGVAFIWGDGRFYQTGLPGGREEGTPTRVPGLPRVSALACGGLHTLAARSGGGLLALGANQNGALGVGRAKVQTASRPALVAGPPSVESLAAGWKHSAAVDAAGQLWAWGWGGSQGSSFELEGRGGTGGQLGLGNEFDYWEPAQVEWLQLSDVDLAAQRPVGEHSPSWRVLRVACGFNHTAAVVEIDGARL